MQKTLTKGDLLTRKISVDHDRTIGFMGEECRVYSTPALLEDIEMTCRDLILAGVAQGEDSVGVTVSLTHMAPTLMGMEVTITAEVTEIEGRKVVLEVTAADSLEQICTCRHQRFVVDVAKTKQRLIAKSAKAHAS
ncbi:MAG: LysR family transcriptional regulator [Alphaproteobacteria bacterium]|nr:LysR family transcriptional regulator [Alphaproteobacteria bacterium]